MSRIPWDDPRNDLDTAFASRQSAHEALRAIVVEPPSREDADRASEKPGKCYVYDRARRTVIEIDAYAS